jgi:hypothetical protein
MAYLKRELLARTGAEGLHGDRGGGVLSSGDFRPVSAGDGSPDGEDGDCWSDVICNNGFLRILTYSLIILQFLSVFF